jgi:hypothetical protein
VFVGVGVGVLVGVFVGVFVGVLVGVSVGVFVGVSVGVFVGVLVGVFVGVLVGVFVGVLVGVFVGVLVGVFVGVSVGVLVGVLVGVFVGVSVGVLVGVLVGVGVGVHANTTTALVALPDTGRSGTPASFPLTLILSVRNVFDAPQDGAVSCTSFPHDSVRLPAGPRLVTGLGLPAWKQSTGVIVPPDRGTWFVTARFTTPCSVSRFRTVKLHVKLLPGATGAEGQLFVIEKPVVCCAAATRGKATAPPMRTSAAIAGFRKMLFKCAPFFKKSAGRIIAAIRWNFY